MESGFILIFVVVVALILAILMSSRRGGTGLDKKKITASWNSIHTALSGGELGRNQAIMEADKLLDYVMRAKGFKGETMGDRLRSAQNKFRNRDSIWQAHKLRNRVVHETGFVVGEARARQAVADFRQGLKDLGAL